MAKCLPSFPKSPEAGRKLGSTGEELSLPMSVYYEQQQQQQKKNQYNIGSQKELNNNIKQNAMHILFKSIVNLCKKKYKKQVYYKQ
jgi:hypothetical protein